MSINRVQTLKHLFKANGILRHRQNWLKFRPHFRTIATDGKITIDGITKDLIKPNNPLFVPQKFGELYDCPK